MTRGDTQRPERLARCSQFSDAYRCPLEEIQRRALVPLELELAVLDVISPDEFEGMVFNALDHSSDRKR